jgi:hypothetical protein
MHKFRVETAGSFEPLHSHQLARVTLWVPITTTPLDPTIHHATLGAIKCYNVHIAAPMAFPYTVSSLSSASIHFMILWRSFVTNFAHPNKTA